MRKLSSYLIFAELSSAPAKYAHRYRVSLRDGGECFTVLVQRWQCPREQVGHMLSVHEISATSTRIVCVEG